MNDASCALTARMARAKRPSFPPMCLIALAISVTAPAGLAAQDAPASGRLERIARQGEVRVCIWPDYYSISYRDPRTGTLVGVDIDMARALAKDLGVAIRFVDSGFKTLVDDLSNDRCDISMHGIGVTEARRKVLRFTPPHLRGGIYAVTTKAHPLLKSWADIDREGVVVVAQAGTYMEPVMRAHLKHAKLEVVNTPEAREREVASGRADVFVTDYPYSRKMLAIHDWALLLIPPTPLAPVPYAYAVAPGDDAWLARVTDFVRRAKKDGTLVRAAAENDLTAIVDLND